MDTFQNAHLPQVFAPPVEGSYTSNQLFEWLDDMPKPVGSRKAMQREQVQQMYHAGGALPYRGEWNAEYQCFIMDDPRFEGATNLEVMVIKQIEAAARGDMKVIDTVMDRILGKPKQAVESVSMNMSYTEFLEQSAQQAKLEPYENVEYEYELPYDELVEDVEPAELSEDEIDELIEGI